MEDMLQEKLIKFSFGMRMEKEGIEQAYKNEVEEARAIDEKVMKEIKKKYKKDADFVFSMQDADFKLQFIKLALMFKEKKEVKKAIPFIAEELRKIADELEEAR